MSNATPTEELVEDVTIGLLQSLSVPNRRGVQIDEAGERANATAGVLHGRLMAALQNFNPSLPQSSCEEAVRLLLRPPHPTLIENNRWFHDLLTDGVPVEYKDATIGETRGGRARLIDFDNPANNDFLIVRQLTIAGANGKTIRPDLVLYVNGLPLVVIELKDPANAAADLNVAIDQLGRYKTIAPDLFVPNLLLVASDGLLTRVGSITSGRQRFTPWRPASGGEPTLEALIRELAEPRRPAGLSAVVRGVRGRRAREHRQEGGRLSPVPRGAQGAGKRHRRRSRRRTARATRPRARAAWSGTRRAAARA